MVTTFAAPCLPAYVHLSNCCVLGPPALPQSLGRSREMPKIALAAVLSLSHTMGFLPVVVMSPWRALVM
jgi:hypothetical protein